VFFSKFVGSFVSFGSDLFLGGRCLGEQDKYADEEEGKSSCSIEYCDARSVQSRGRKMKESMGEQWRAHPEHPLNVIERLGDDLLRGERLGDLTKHGGARNGKRQSSKGGGAFTTSPSHPPVKNQSPKGFFSLLTGRRENPPSDSSSISLPSPSIDEQQGILSARRRWTVTPDCTSIACAPEATC
jgi:hypothetical protein